MKRFLTASALVLSATANAQWVGNGNDLSNTNIGNVGIGTATPAAKLDVVGSVNLSTGNRLTIGGTNAFHMAGTRNVAMGPDAGTALLNGGTGTNNIFVGDGAGEANTTGSRNVFFGFSAGHLNTTGSNNIAIGPWAGAVNTTASNNLFIGYQSGFTNQTGQNNNYIGYYTGRFATGSNNTFFGHRSGENTSTGTNNTFIGRIAGQGNTTGTGNTYIGSNARGSATIINATAIGIDAEVTQSNSVVIGSPTTNMGIGVSAPTQKLHVAGNARITGAIFDSYNDPGTAGQVLSSTATGTDWINASALQGPAGPQGPTGPQGVQGEQGLQGPQGPTGPSTLQAAYEGDRTITANTGALKVAGTDGLLITGTFGSGAGVEVSGAGTRMFFNPKKAAFRAGEVDGTQWDNDNVGIFSTAMGRSTTASGGFSTAMGSFTTASGSNSTAMGIESEASGVYSTAMGAYTTASGYNTTAIGNGSVATGYASTAMGSLTHATGEVSTAMGAGTDASGDYSTAMGAYTTASGFYSTAMGEYTTASGYYTTAIGFGSVATGHSSTALGNNTDASGEASTAMGAYTTASGFYSTAMGRSTTAPSYVETAIGLFNTYYSPASAYDWNAADRLFVVGNGFDGNRSDALRMLKNGNTAIGNIDPTTKLDVDGQIRMRGGAPAAGKVLTSDADGLASWQTIGAGSGTLTVPQGGTGSTALTGYVKGNGTAAMTASSTIPVADINGTLPVSKGGTGATTLTGVLKGNGTGAVSAMTGTSNYVSRWTNSTTLGIGSLYDNGTNVGVGTITPSSVLDVVGNLEATTATIAGSSIENGDFVGNAFNGVINMGGSINALANVIGDVPTPSIVTASGDEDLWIEDELEVVGAAYKTGGGSWTAISDKRLKTDVENYTDGLEQLKKVRPVWYRYNEVWPGLADGRRFVGVLAQEMQQVAPYMVQELPFGRTVRENEDGTETVIDPGTPYLTYDPSALDYMLINAVKEVNAKVEAVSTEGMVSREEFEALQAKNDRLEKLVEQLIANQRQFEGDLQQCCFEHSNTNGTTGLNQQSTTDSPRLEQNQPNPFHENTTIRYYLPNGTRTASISISDLNGVQLKTFDLSGGRGVGQVLIGGGAFAAGTYVYTLTVEGKQVDSKRMVLM